MSTLSESIKPSFVDPMKTCYSVQNSYKVKVVSYIKSNMKLHYKHCTSLFIMKINLITKMSGMFVLLAKNPFFKIYSLF